MTGKGGFAVLLNWCMFDGFESMLHDVFTTDPLLLKQLTNVYAVCIARRNTKNA